MFDLFPDQTFRPRNVLLLTGLVLIIAALHYSWLTANTLPPHWDQASHMMSALKYHDVMSQCLAEASVSLSRWKHCAGELVYVNHFVYPPLFHAAGGVLVFLGGASINALALTNLPFIAVLAVAMFAMGSVLHSQRAGLIAALLILAYPLIFQMSREFMLDFALLAMYAAALCFLVLADGFRRRGMSLLFGATAGLAVLTKFTAVTYLIGPTAVVFTMILVRAARRQLNRREVARRLVNGVAALVLGAAIAALWYVPNLAGFLGALRSVASLDVIGTPVWSPRSVAYYVSTMIWTQMGPPLFLLFVFGLLRFTRLVSPDHRSLLLGSIVPLYVIQTLTSHKGPHNSIGLLVPAALISAVGVASLARYRRVAITALVLFVSLQLAVLTLPERTLGGRIGTFGWSGVVSPYPRSEDWKIEEALESLSANESRVAVVSDHIFINGTTVQLYAVASGRPLQVTRCGQSANGEELPDPTGFDVVLAKSDDGWVRPKADGCFREEHGREEYNAVLRQLRDPANGFVLRRSLPLPDTSSLLVFTRESRGEWASTRWAN